MKKILAALAAALLLCCPVTAFAAETQLDTAPASQGIEVYGQCISNKNYYEIVLGTERADSAHLPDGVVISGRSSASEDRGLRVIIIPVTAAEEPEAYAWLSGAAQDLGKEPVAYYLAFYRDSTPAQSRGEVTLTVTSRQGTDLFYMDGSARSAKLSYAAESDSIRFQMEKTGYYLTVKNDKPPRPEEPKTGDSFRPEPYLLTMAASAAALLLLCRGRRKREA